MLCEQFVAAIASADQLLEQILEQKVPIQMSLEQLSQLHHLQRQLEQFKFLNIVYSNATRMRKVLSRQASQQISLQKELCKSVDTVLAEFMGYFNSLDRLILNIINMQLNASTFDSTLQHLIRATFCCREFRLEWGEGTMQSSKFEADDSLQCGAVTLHLKGDETQFAKPLRKSFSTTQLQAILEHLVQVVAEERKELYTKDTLVLAIRGTKSIVIKNALNIAQRILQSSIESSLKTKCSIHNRGSAQFTKLKEYQEVTFLKDGTLVIPVKINEQIQFYFETENITIDVITFSDYLQQRWQNLTFHIRDLKQQDFLNQMIEVNTPSKLFLGVNQNLDIVYQSGSIPASWSFVEMPILPISDTLNVSHLKMEHVYKVMLTQKINELKQSAKAAIECGSIYFSDKQVDINIFVRRDELEGNPLFYVAFDQPKKKIDDMITSQVNIKSDLAIEVLTQLKSEKINKACHILKEQLNISLNSDEIVELLKEREMELEVFQQQHITQEIRDSYIIEYYKTEFNSSRQMTVPEMSSPSPFRTLNMIKEQSLKLQKFDLFTIDENDYNNLNSWEFTTINLPEDHTSERIRLAWSFFQLSNFTEYYQIKGETFYQFLVVVQERYNCRANPFHNFDHAIQVAHACYFFIKHKMMNQYLDQIEQFAALLSALCHDVDHTGRTNGFEMGRRSRLAIRYNDDSVLENHHVSCMYKILSRDQCNILGNLSPEQFQVIRRFSINNILATDMKRHFELIKQVEIKFAKMNETGESIIQKEDDRRLISGVFTHIFDLSGSTKSYSVARQWSLRICQEFSSQVDEELGLGLPVTPYLQNLNNTFSIAKNEISFIKVIVRPLYELAIQLAGQELQVACQNLDSNQKEWEKALN